MVDGKDPMTPSHRFGYLSAIVTPGLASDYYIQFSVIPMSLINRETERIPLLIRYNPHGIFLAMEELGYLVM
jgi:hypothetical protein